MKKVIVLVLVSLLFLTGYDYREKTIYKKQAKENTIEYFKKKYKIEPTIKSVRVLRKYQTFGIVSKDIVQ